MRRLLSLLFVLVSVNCFGLSQEASELLKEAPFEIGGGLDQKFDRFIVILEALEQSQDQTHKEMLRVNLDLEVRLIVKSFSYRIKEQEENMQHCLDHGYSDQNCKKERDELLHRLKIFRLIVEQASYL